MIKRNLIDFGARLCWDSIKEYKAKTFKFPWNFELGNMAVACVYDV